MVSAPAEQELKNARPPSPVVTRQGLDQNFRDLAEALQERGRHRCDGRNQQDRRPRRSIRSMPSDYTLIPIEQAPPEQ